jgi:phosphoribosylamine--glycine ligase
MNILLIGSGGREHALAWAISASSLCTKLYCAPGNAGMAAVGECVDVKAEDHAGVIAFCRDNGIDFVVVGPEAPLVAGLKDYLDASGIKTFGPSAKAAQLEGSKGFTKDLCSRHDIPTAAYGRFGDADAAIAYARSQGAPIVVKADGLAAGKGVIIAETIDEAETAIGEIFSGKFGDAGVEVVVEEFLTGEEASLFALSDGEHVVLFGTAQDHKRVGDGDTGPNTGGMGAYSPAPVMDEAMTRRAFDEIIAPTVKSMAAEGNPYQGVLYAGLMIGADGPKLIEYNCRFGDPECQVLMMRLKDDLVTLMLAACDGTLDKVSVRWRDDAALCVVMAAEGYPGPVEKGSVINGLDAAAEVPEVEIFHAGTKSVEKMIQANGGRVLNVCALGASVTEARDRAYEAVSRIDWPAGFCRSDIGWRAIEREGSAS